MELFGYVCSPLCKNKAETKGVAVPVFAGQKSVVERRAMRKVLAITGSVAAVLASVVGVWIWYTWFASVPGPVFSVRFDQPAESGQVRLSGKDQIVFIRDGTLSRYDLKTKKEVWAVQLIDQEKLKQRVAAELKSMRVFVDRYNSQVEDHEMKMPSPEEMTREIEKEEFGALHLRVVGENIWVSSPGKLVRHDWNDGKPSKEISLADDFYQLIPQGDELLQLKENDAGQRIITRINLASGESKVEEIGEPRKPVLVAAAGKKTNNTAVASARRSGPRAGGTPAATTGADANQPIDPQKVAEQAQNMSYPARIALPAVLANTMNQERIMAELRDPTDGRPRAGSGPDLADYFRFIPSRYGYVEFAVRMIEPRFIARKAMKDPPAKSALDGNLTVTKTTEVANEILNEMQRNRGADTVTEDESRYLVKLRRPAEKDVPEWSSEVIGPPAVFPLKTVDVVTAGKTVIVLDKSSKKRWQSSLTYNVIGDSERDEDNSRYGQGPCVERGDTLYVFDQAVLTAFNLATGDVRWRVPSVGIVGLFFDDKEMLYVNTTTASPDQIKYSRQIDIGRSTDSEILKVDPKKGKILWRCHAGGFASYFSGKFIYVVTAHDADDEADSPIQIPMSTPSHIMIRRINPKNGRIMWEHFQKRAPLYYHFDGNVIEVVFKKEVQVLKYLSF